MRQDARENRERILAAAETVFGERGATGSTEEVARLAGVGIATVFRHFPTKEALVEATLLRHFERLIDRAQTLADGPDPATTLHILVRTMIESGATKLTLAAVLIDGGGLPANVAESSSRLKTAVREALRRAQEAGAVRPSIEVDEVYLLIRGLAQASATMANAPGVVDRAVDVVLTGLSSRGEPVPGAR